MAKQKAKTSKKPVKKAVKKPLKKAVKKTVKKSAVKKAPVKKAQPKKKAVAAAPAPLPWRHALPGETLAGVVDDYYSHLSVITLTLQTPLKVGDKIHVRGHTTDMTEIVESMQINHVPVTEAKAGDPIGIKAVGKCRAGDHLYKVG